MKILDKVKINKEVYTCIQILYIDNRKVYKVFNAKTKEEKYICDGKVVKDEKILKKIDDFTHPKTDIIDKIDIIGK